MMPATVASSSLSWPMPRIIPRHSLNECEFPPPFGSMRPRSSQMAALKSISNECWRLSSTPCVRAVGDGRLKTSTARVSDSIAVCLSSRVRRFIWNALVSRLGMLDHHTTTGWSGRTEASRSNATGLLLFPDTLEGLLVGLDVHEAARRFVSLDPAPIGHLGLRALADRANAAVVPGWLVRRHGNLLYVSHRITWSGQSGPTIANE